MSGIMINIILMSALVVWGVYEIGRREYNKEHTPSS